MRADTAGDVAMRVLQLDREDELYNCTVQLVLAARALAAEAKACGEFMQDEGYKRGIYLMEDANALVRALKPFEEP